jgi:hypothetical protein
VSSFPVPEKELSVVRGFLAQLIASISTRDSLSSEVFIQFDQLNVGGAAQLLAAHGRQWMPETGLGVWPDREPPRIWSIQDFMDLGPKEKPRPLMYQVFRVGGEPKNRIDARDIMLGRGTIIEVMTHCTSRELVEKTSATLLPHISDPSYSCFPYYVPLLGRKSVENAGLELLDRWFAGFSVYIRECFEETGLLIASREPLQGILKQMGASPEANSNEWRLFY